VLIDDLVTAAGQAARGTVALLPPAQGKRHRMPPILGKIIAQ